MRSSLTTEVPSLHNTLVTFTFRNCLNVNELPRSEMPWPKHIPNWQKAFRGHFELGKMLLWWESILQKMPSAWLLDFLEILLPNTYLNRVTPIFILRLDLDHLASIDRNDGAMLSNTPVVPEECLPHFIP